MELAKINDFLACKKFAIAGVSRKKEKIGNGIFRELLKQNYDIVPVNPHAETIEGVNCYPTIESLPGDIEALIITTQPETTHLLYQQAVAKGLKHIFIQSGAENQATIEMAKKSEINVIYKRCILMFANPQGMHKFHKVLVKFFGSYPK